MNCNECFEFADEANLLHHLLYKHKYALPALRYRDVQHRTTGSYDPEFKSNNPSFFIAISSALPREFPHPSDVVDTILDLLPGSDRIQLLQYGMAFIDIPKFIGKLNMHLIMHVHGDTDYTGYFDIGDKQLSPIYLRYEYGKHYHAILIDEVIYEHQLDDMIYKMTFKIDNLLPHAELHAVQSALPEDFSSTLTTQLTEILSQVETLRSLPKDFLITLVSSIVSSVVSIAAALVTLLSNKVNKATVAMNAISIVTNLTSFVWNIHNVCKYWQIPFNALNVISGLPELVEKFKPTSDSTPNAPDFIAPAITSVVAVLLSGILTFTPATIKDVISSGSFLKATKEFGGTAQAIVKFIADDICSLHIFGNKFHYDQITNLAKEGTMLVTTPTYRFFQDPTKIYALRTFPNRVVELTSTKISDKETSQALTSAKVMLNNTLSHIYEKVAAIDAVVDSKSRQECFAVYLSGLGGAGKSRLCIYIARKVAAIMGYNPRIFNLQREGTFTLPYGGEVFGIFNEFMNKRSEKDDLLPRFNGIISGDAYNFESAHLSGKVQPCMLKVVFLTSNTDTPQLTRTLEENAAAAVWTRCLRFCISDPKFEGRMAPNAHRREDFSHLVIDRVLNPECTTGNLQKQRVTIDELIASVVFQVATREYNFHKGEDIPLPPERITQLTNIIDQVRPLQPNNKSYGKSFFVIRLQGELDTGKSRLTGEIASTFKSLLPRHELIEITSVSDLETKIPSVLGIYIIDDVVYADSHKKYFEWINQGNPENIYIFATTDVYERKSLSLLHRVAGLMLPDFYPQSYVLETEAPEGIGRRLGLEGLIRIKTPYRTLDTFNPLHLCVTLTTHKGFRLTHENIGITKEQAMQLIYARYISFIKATNQIILVKEPYRGPPQHTVSVKTRNYTSLLRTLSNPISLFKAYNDSHEGTIVRVHPSFAKTMFQKTFVKDWIVPETLTTDDEFIALARRMTAALRRSDPKATCHIEFTEINKELVYANNVIHWEVDVQEFDNYGVSQEGLITCQTRGTQVTITHEELAAFKTNGVISDNMSQIPLLVLQNLDVHYKKLAPAIRHGYEISLMKMGHDKMMNGSLRTQIYAYLKDNKVAIVAAGLITVAGVTGIGYGIYKLFVDNKEHFLSNTSEEEDGEFGKFTQRMRQHVMSGNRDGIQQVRHEAKVAGYSDRLNKWEYEWRSNTMKSLALPAPTFELAQSLVIYDPHKQLEEYMRQYPELMARYLSRKDNGMSQLEECHQTPTLIDTFVSRLNKMYFKIIAPAGVNYAISLGFNKILTVSHIVNRVGETGELSSDGTLYPIRCVAICRDRDLSIWIITSKQAPATPLLTKFLLPHANFEGITRAWFVRPSAIKSICAQAEVSFIEHTILDRTDTNNARYCPREKLWDFSLINVRNVSEVIRRGDCGLPLVAIVNNEPKIIGIHNAFSMIGTATYSAISREDIDIFLKDDVVSNAITLTKDDFLIHTMDESRQHFCTVPEIREAVLSEWESSKFTGTSKLDVYGYAPKLHMYSNPKHSKRYIPIQGSPLKCESLPSAIVYDPRHVKDASGLVTDKYGKPHTLFTECVKYTLRTDTYRQWDQETLDHTLSVISLRIKTDYEPFRALNTKEVLNGLSKLQPFDLKTSAGPYFKLVHGITNKEQLLVNKAPEGVKPYYDWNDTQYGKKLQEQYARYVTAIKEGIPIFVMSKDNAKVELLPREKVHKGKVRLFNEIDFAINMTLKKFFGFALNDIMEKSMDTPYAIGSNFYLLGTSIRRDFNVIGGNVLSTDFKAMDKRMCKEMIMWFCEAFLWYLPKKARKALANTLIYTLHVMDGHVYSVDSGNESGSFVTTLLNSFAVEVNLLYHFCKTYRNKYGTFPSLKEVRTNIRYKVMGDDMTAITLLDFDLPSMIEDAKLFNMDLTMAKVETNNPSFCSREIVPSGIHPLVWFARLKKSSITTCLFYFSDLSPPQIAANVNVALFEASMWDEEYFSQVQQTCFILVRKYHCQQFFEGYTYKQYRTQICNYILGYQASPTLLAVGGQISHINLSDNTLFTANTISDIMDPISTLNTYIQRHNLKPMEWHEINVGTSNQPIWQTTLIFHDITGIIETQATEPGKKANARKAAAILCVSQLVLKIPECEAPTGDSQKIPNSDTVKYDVQEEVTIVSSWREGSVYYADHSVNCTATGPVVGRTRCQAKKKLLQVFGFSYTHDFVNEHISAQVNKARELASELNVSVIWLYVNKTVKYTEDTKTSWHGIGYYRTPCGDDENAILMLSDICQRFEYHHMSPHYELYGAISHNEGICIDFSEIPNTKDPMVEPSSIQQTAVNSQAGTLPPPTNPQPTGMVPTMAPAGESAISAVEGITTQVLNPVGAPNMTGVGAIMFDLKTLIYSQFMDSDVEIQITDDAPSGSILLQIPYDPLGVHVNKYIRRYVGDHERYTGALMFRFTVVGNPLFSGYIGVSWQPRKVKTPTIDISEFQKFSYDSKGVTLPWSEVHVLHDARKQYFYRETADQDIDDRPHLVVALIVSIQNPLREGVITRLRVASKLASISEPNPFFVTFPHVPSAPASRAITGSNQTTYLDMLPEARNTRSWIYTDGVYSVPDRRGFTESFQILFNSPSGSFYGQLSGVSNATLGMSSSLVHSSFVPTHTPAIVFPQPHGRFGIYVTTNTTPEVAFGIAYFMKINIANNVYSYWQHLTDANYWRGVPTTTWISSSYDSTVIDITTGVITKRICGTLKVVTEHGIIIFSLIGMFSNNADNLTSEIYAIPSAKDKLSPIPYANIDNISVGANKDISRLPLGYQALKFTELPPSSVTIEGMTLPTASNNHTIISIFKEKAKELTDTQVIQFQLTDSVSVRVIATVRFLQESSEFVINLPTDSPVYRVLGVSNENITFTNIATINRTNDFPITSVTGWISRTASDFVRRSDVFRSYGMPTSITTANGAAMAVGMAGGAMSGMGQAIQTQGQHKHEAAMAQDKYTHENFMQNNMFEQQNKYQHNQYQHENMLQDQQHLFQQAMQQAGFGHDVNMSDLQHMNTMTQRSADTRNRMLEKGMSVASARMPGGGVIGVA